MTLNLKKELYKNIFRIRTVEETIAAKYKTGEDGLMRCPVHLSSGQEVVAAAFSKIVKKIKYDEIDDSNLTLLNESTYENLYKIALKYADGAILTSDLKNKFSDVLKNIDIPILECPHSSDDYKEKYSEFYNSFLLNED